MDAVGFLVVVVQEVAEEAGKAILYVAGEADGFTVIGCDVFGEFSVDVVGGEQGVMEGTGEFGRGTAVGELILFEGLLEEGDFSEGGGVGGVFIGVEGEGGVGRRVPVGGEILEEGGERSGEGPARGFGQGL